MTMLGTRPAPPGGRPPIDPRIRQRRIEVSRESGRRRLRVLIALVSLTVAILGADLILHSSFLSVSKIDVRGVHATTSASVDVAAAAVLHHPMMSADTSLVAARVAALPWVERVQVSRHWPSTLIVSVTERTPVAQLAEGQQWALLDASGRVLSVAPGQVPGVVDLEAPKPPAAAGSTVPASDQPAVDVAAALRSSPALAGGPVVDAVIAADDGQVTLALAGGIEVEVGPATSLADKLTALATVVSGVDLSGVKTIDLRVPERPVLTRG